MEKYIKLIAIIAVVGMALIWAYDNGYLFPGASGPTGA